MKFAVLDTETTGTRPETDKIVELFAGVWDGGTFAKTLHFVFNPGRPIPEGAAKVHGWTDDKVERMPRFGADHVQQLLELLDCDGPVYVHNLDFDLTLVLAEAGRVGADVQALAALPWSCTLKMARELWPGATNTLGAVAERLQVDIRGPEHLATTDVDTLARCVEPIVHRYAYRSHKGALAKQQAPAPVPAPASADELLVMAGQKAEALLPRVAAASEWAAGYTCADDDDENLGHEGLGRLKKLQADADAQRKAVVEPIKQVTGKVDALFREKVAKPCDEAKARVEQHLARYASEKLRKKREAEAEAQRKLEAERKKAAELAAAAQAGSAQAAQQLEQQEARVHEAVVEAAEAAEQGPGPVKAGTSTGGYKTKWTATITDPSRVPDVYWRPDLALVQHAVDQGAREIPGVAIVEEVVVSNRRRS